MSEPPPSPETQAGTDLSKIAAEGVELCRRGGWEQGIRFLAYAAESGVEQLPIAPLVYSYLGFGIAHTQARYKDGLALCKRAVEMQVYEPDTYMNLARVYALCGHQGEAFNAIMAGLKLDGFHRGLRQLRRELSTRRPPVLPFLKRRHPINRFLGGLRHQIIVAFEALMESSLRVVRRWTRPSTARTASRPELQFPEDPLRRSMSASRQRPRDRLLEMRESGVFLASRWAERLKKGRQKQPPQPSSQVGSHRPPS